MGGRDDRDRDAEGRARNARPRDPTGRPLARGMAGTTGPAEDVLRSPAEAVDTAQRLLDADRPFQAHEVLEGTWKAAGDAERDLWRGLAQLAVGLTHVQRGNAVGATALLERGVERITPFAPSRPYGVDVPGLVAYATELAARIRVDGLAALTEADRRPLLRGH